MFNKDDLWKLIYILHTNAIIFLYDESQMFCPESCVSTKAIPVLSTTYQNKIKNVKLTISVQCFGWICPKYKLPFQVLHFSPKKGCKTLKTNATSQAYQPEAFLLSTIETRYD